MGLAPTSGLSGKARLIGSRRRDRDSFRYAASNVARLRKRIELSVTRGSAVGVTVFTVVDGLMGTDEMAVVLMVVAVVVEVTAVVVERRLVKS